MTLPRQQAAVGAELLPQIIEAYLETKVAEGAIAARTADSYRNNLNPWFAFWEQCPDIHNYKLSADILQSAYEWMQDEYRNSLNRPAHHNSLVHCWIKLKQVFNWAFVNNCTENVNLTEWCPHVDRVDSPQYFPDVEDMKALFAQPAGNDRLRDLATMAFMLSTGARRYEVANALIEHLTFATPLTSLVVDADHSGTCHLFRVKGDREGLGVGRIVVFGNVAGLMIKAHLRASNRAEGTIFGLTDTGIGQMIEKHAIAAGLPEISPHAFRRCLSDYWDEKRGLAGRAALKRQLGHSTGKDVTERHYLTKNPKRTAREIAKWYVSPLDELDFDWTIFPVHVP